MENLKKPLTLAKYFKKNPQAAVFLMYGIPLILDSKAQGSLY